MNTVDTLVEAASTSNQEKAQACLYDGVDVNAFIANGMKNPLMVAVFARDISMVRFLMSWGADVNVSSRDGRTALMIAIDQNNPEMFDLLLRERADINAKAADGTTVLDLAISKRRSGMVQALRDKGARGARYF